MNHEALFKKLKEFGFDVQLKKEINDKHKEK